MENNPEHLVKQGMLSLNLIGHRAVFTKLISKVVFCYDIVVGPSLSFFPFLFSKLIQAPRYECVTENYFLSSN